MLRVALRLSIVAALAVTVSGCGLRRPDIYELQREPWRYHDRTVEIDGVVTSSWGLPLAPVGFYRISDGTGEVTVLSQGRRTPGRGARVIVRGRVGELAVLGGSSVGLHLREERLRIRRR